MVTPRRYHHPPPPPPPPPDMTRVHPIPEVDELSNPATARVDLTAGPGAWNAPIVAAHPPCAADIGFGRPVPHRTLRRRQARLPRRSRPPGIVRRGDGVCGALRASQTQWPGWRRSRCAGRLGPAPPAAIHACGPKRHPQGAALLGHRPTRRNGLAALIRPPRTRFCGVDPGPAGHSGITGRVSSGRALGPRPRNGALETGPTSPPGAITTAGERGRGTPRGRRRAQRAHRLTPRSILMLTGCCSSHNGFDATRPPSAEAHSSAGGGGGAEVAVGVTRPWPSATGSSMIADSGRRVSCPSNAHRRPRAGAASPCSPLIAPGPRGHWQERKNVTAICARWSG